MKNWIEVKRGYVVEMSAVRTVSAGDGMTCLAEGNRLYLEFIGSKSKMTIVFESIEAKWKGYDLVKEALIPEEKKEE